MSAADLPRVAQMTREQLAGLPSADVAAARRRGALAEAFGQPAPVDVERIEPGRLTRADLRELHPADIVALREAGRLDHLLAAGGPDAA